MKKVNSIWVWNNRTIDHARTIEQKLMLEQWKTKTCLGKIGFETMHQVKRHALINYSYSIHTINALINYSPEEEDQGDLGRGSEGRPGGSRTPGVPGRAWQ